MFVIKQNPDLHISVNLSVFTKLQSTYRERYGGKIPLKINLIVTRGDGLGGIILAWDLLIAVFTPHYLAGHYGCVEALVTWGADVDMDIPHMGTALYTACVCQELECARTLLREGQPAAVC